MRDMFSDLQEDIQYTKKWEADTNENNHQNINKVEEIQAKP